MDVILNGKAHGSIAGALLQNNLDVNVLRPFIGVDGRQYMTQNHNGVLKAVPVVGNATATLRKDEWKTLDMAVVKAAKPRLKAVADLRAAGLTYTIPNGMGKTILETETQSDINDASISMDGMREGANDRPLYELTSLPLPIIHKDFSFTARQIATSRNGGSPLDTTMAELAGRKVAEEAEKLLLGWDGTADKTYTYGGGNVYGYVNFPNRITYNTTDPTASGWTGSTLIADILAMQQASRNAYHYGPWKLYFGTGWGQYLGDDFKTNSDKSLVARVKELEDIEYGGTLDYLNGTRQYNILLVQQTSDVARMVIGMDITTVQWESNGGMKQNFKVMAIMVPQLRTDQYDNTGIVHGS